MFDFHRLNLSVMGFMDVSVCFYFYLIYAVRKALEICQSREGMFFYNVMKCKVLSYPKCKWHTFYD